MLLNDPQHPTSDPESTELGTAPQDTDDGGFPIEGDGGVMDSGGQAHVPPSPPPV
ncbi:MAG TPA: hypothetical protein VGM86_22095 [Thermoanaerobaculia bacterium]|jgi:hypothetical protein